MNKAGELSSVSDSYKFEESNKRSSRKDKEKLSPQRQKLSEDFENVKPKTNALKKHRRNPYS